VLLINHSILVISIASPLYTNIDGLCIKMAVSFCGKTSNDRTDYCLYINFLVLTCNLRLSQAVIPGALCLYTRKVCMLFGISFSVFLLCHVCREFIMSILQEKCL